jgi:dTMP kinase
MTEAGGAAPRRGLFITFEGGDGSGKSTQIRRVAARLTSMGYAVVTTAEPGGTRIGKAIREILLNPEHTELAPRAEMLLYFASRAQNVAECILPALAESKIVISDRYTDSTLAYQGIARGLGADAVRDVHRFACQGLDPDITIVLELDVETGLARARQKADDRIEQEGRSFHNDVLRAYRRLAAEEPARVRLVNAGRSVEEVADDVWRQLKPHLARLPRPE